jgi:hypothetical protein
MAQVPIERLTIHQKVPSSLPSDPPTAAAPDIAGERGGMRDVSLQSRSSTTLQIRSKFEDVFQVKTNCTVSSESAFTDYSDDVSVAGRLSDPKAVKKFNL